MVHYLSPVLRLGLGSVRVRLGFQLDFWLEVRGSIRVISRLRIGLEGLCYRC